MRSRSSLTVGLLLLASLAVTAGGLVRGGGKPAPLPLTPAGAQEAATAWLPGSWGYRIPIDAVSDSVAGNGVFLDFPLVLPLDSGLASVFAHARSDGSDLRVAKGDGVTLLHSEVVDYDPQAQKAEVWFRADSLSKTRNRFFLYYGNPSPGAPPAGSVWNDRYVAVYHFQEDPGAGVLKDFSPRGNDASSAGYRSAWTSGDVTAGQFGQAWNFNGTTHWIDGDRISSPDSSYVISAWIMNPSNSTDFAFQASPGFWHISSQINESPVNRRPHYQIANPNREIRWGPNPLPNDGLYHYFTWVFDGDADTILFYFDGKIQPAQNWYVDSTVVHIYTGNPVNPDGTSNVGVMGPMSWNSYDLMTGPADEFRMNERTHGADWIRTEYRSQRNPDAFFTAGSEETNGPVPVLLSRFEGRREGPSVILTWELASSASDLAGFWVDRDAGGERVRATPVLLPAAPFTEWRDPAPPEDEAGYWLGTVGRTGTVEEHGPVTVAAARWEAGPFLAQSVPNPARGGARIAFRIPAPGSARLTLFDLGGRPVRTLLDGSVDAGDHTASWDGRDRTGRPVPAGIYFYRLESAGSALTRRLILIP